jgi:hypothetical protein
MPLLSQYGSGEPRADLPQRNSQSPRPDGRNDNHAVRYAGPVLIVSGNQPQPCLDPEARRWVEDASASVVIGCDHIEDAAIVGQEGGESLKKFAANLHRSDPAIATARGIMKAAISAASQQIEEYDQQLLDLRQERFSQAMAVSVAQSGGWFRATIVVAASAVIAYVGRWLVAIDATNAEFLVRESGLFEEGAPAWNVLAFALPAVIAPPILLKLADGLSPPRCRKALRVGVIVASVALCIATPLVYGPTLGAMHSPVNPFADDLVGEAGSAGSGGSGAAGGFSNLVSVGMALIGLSLYGLGLALVWLAKAAVVWRRVVNAAWRDATARIKATLGRRLEWSHFRDQLQEILNELQCSEDAFVVGALLRWSKSIAIQIQEKEQQRRRIEDQIAEADANHQRNMQKLSAQLNSVL